VGADEARDADHAHHGSEYDGDARHGRKHTAVAEGSAPRDAAAYGNQYARPDDPDHHAQHDGHGLYRRYYSGDAPHAQGNDADKRQANDGAHSGDAALARDHGDDA